MACSTALSANVERADGVPDLRLGGEIAGSGFGAVGAHRRQPYGVRGQHVAAQGIEPLVDKVENRLRARVGGQRQEHPAAFLVAVEQAGVAENLHVARDARLALAQHVRQFADRQFHIAQERQDADPRRIGKRLEKIGNGQVRGHRIRI